MGFLFLRFDMSSTKRLFAIINILFVLCTFCLCTVQASEREYRIGDTGQLLGFHKLEYELAINPCLEDKVVREHYTEADLQNARAQMTKYPPGLCENKQILSMLANWNYNSSALLANSERPFILGREIAIEHAQIKKCKTLDCLQKRLPNMLEWSKTMLSRTPISSRDVDSLFMKSTPIEHPRLALRGLKLPLSNQKEVCGGNDISALKFASSSLIVADRALAIVTCQEENKLGTWLLEKREDIAQWKEILVLPGIANVAILPNNRELYPHIFYKQRNGKDETMTIMRYSEAWGYQKRVQFDLSFDEYGLAHAFNVKVF